MAPGPDNPMVLQGVQDRAIFPLRLDSHSTFWPAGLAVLQWLMIHILRPSVTLQIGKDKLLFSVFSRCPIHKKHH